MVMVGMDRSAKVVTLSLKHGVEAKNYDDVSDAQLNGLLSLL